MSERRRVGLVGLLLASGISSAGSRVSVIAIPWLVLVTTGSAAQTGVVAFAEMLPFVLVQAFGAPLVDRFGGRPVSIICDVASVVILVVVPVMYDAGRLPFPALCVLVAVLGAFRGPGENAKHVLVPEVVAEAKVPMERGAGLLDGATRAGSLVGAPLGGVLAATVGALNALYVDAASFLVAALLVQLFVTRKRTKPAPGEGGYLHELREGMRFVVRDPLLRAIGLMVLATNMFDQAQASVLVPVWAKTMVGSAAAIGWMGGAFGLGALVGNAVFAMVAHRMPRRMTYAICFLLAGPPRYFFMAGSGSLPGIIVVYVLSGLACGAINPLLGAAEFERIPERMRARVLGAVGALAFAGIPFGGLLAGWLVSWSGLSTALLVVGIGYLVMTLLPFVQPAWKLMERDKTPLSPVEASPADRVARR